MSDSILKDKSYAFALRVVKLSRHLQKEQQEYILSRQVLRSGTSIGTLIMEAEFAESSKDFVHKMSIALKEANETKYWFNLIKDSELIETNLFDSLHSDVKEIIAMLVSTIKTLKSKL